MIGAHATFTDATERHVGIGNMHHGVVDAATTELDVGQYVALYLLAAGEQVQCQRMFRQGANLTVQVVKVGILQQRQYRAKNFFLHDRIRDADAAKDGRGNKLAVTVGLAADQHLGRVDQRRHPVKVALVSSGNLYLRTALSLLPNVQLSAFQPEDVLPEGGADLVIYDRSVPDTLPESGALWFIAPPKSAPFFSVTGLVESPAIRAVDAEARIVDAIPFFAGLPGRAIELAARARRGADPVAAHPALAQVAFVDRAVAVVVELVALLLDGGRAGTEAERAAHALARAALTAAHTSLRVNLISAGPRRTTAITSSTFRSRMR